MILSPLPTPTPGAWPGCFTSKVISNYLTEAACYYFSGFISWFSNFNLSVVFGAISVCVFFLVLFILFGCFVFLWTGANCLFFCILAPFLNRFSFTVYRPHDSKIAMYLGKLLIIFLTHSYNKLIMSRFELENFKFGFSPCLFIATVFGFEKNLFFSSRLFLFFFRLSDLVCFRFTRANS